MQPGGVKNADLYQVRANLWVNGADIATDIHSLRVERDIPSGLPGAGGGFRAASGSILATRGDDVSDRVQHPWNRTGNWPPRPMDSVRLDLADGQASWQQLHGSVDGAVGGVGSRQVAFDLVDHYQALDRQVSLEPLLDAMPALEEASTARYIGLQSSYVTDRVLRAVGRFATPPMASGCIVSAPLMGSTWPERGVLTSSIRSTTGAYPLWTSTNYGVAAQDVDARYAPALHSGENGIFDRPLEITAEWLPGMDGSHIRAQFGASHVSISFTAANAVARYTSGTETNIRSIPRVDANGTKQRIVARFTLAGSTLTVSMRSSLGNGDVIDEGSSSVTVPAGAFSSPMSEVRIVGQGIIGAFQVGFPQTPFASVEYERSAVISTPSSARNALKVLPAVVNMKATTLLNEQADAELASWWIDETNVLRWMDRQTLRTRPSVGNLTTADHVKRINWAHNMESVRSSVTVKWKDPLIDRRWRTDLTLWESGGGKIYDGETQEQIISVPSDEVWIMPAGVDNTPQQSQKVRVTASNTAAEMQRINYGQWTIVGGIRADANGDQALTSAINGAFTKITDEAYKVTITCGTVSGGGPGLLQLPTDWGVLPGLWKAEQGQNLPVLRGKGKATLVDASTTSAITGPANAPEHVIDAGWWIQYPEQARAIADYAAEAVTVPQPIITGLDIVPVFNLQVGDVITINAPDVMGMIIAGIVTSNRISIDFESAAADQSVTIRPVSTTLGYPAWGDFGAAQSGRTWDGFGAAWDGRTWSDFGTNPLSN